jgi:hypothetical protein
LFPEQERLSLPESWEGSLLASLRKVLFLTAACILGPSCGGGGGGGGKVLPPNAPTNLVASQGTTARIDLTWTKNSVNESGFIVERSENGSGGPYTTVASLLANTQAYSDFGLLPGQTYFYQVAAINSGGSSPFAGPASATTKTLVWRSSTGGPGIRADHSATYDSVGQRMILIGGIDDTFTLNNDVWSLDLKSKTSVMTTPPTNHWTLLLPGSAPNAPSARYGHSAIFDSLYNRIIVFAGQDGSNPPPPATSYRQDVYILTLGITPSWSPATVTGPVPSPRRDHTAIYDAANQQMVIYGGKDGGPVPMSDAVILSLPQNPPLNWTIIPSVGPIGRTRHSAIYDAFREQMVIFAGLDNQTLPDGSVLNNETWSLDLNPPNFWTQPPLASTPGFRQGHTAVFDVINSRMIVFGGDTTTMPMSSNELWSMRLDTPQSWTFLSPWTGTPPAARYGHKAVYDAAFQRMIIYGGYDNSSLPTFGDTWLSDF